MDNGAPINTIFRFFRNLRLTAVIFSSLILIYFLGLVIPQKWMFETKEGYGGWVAGSVLHRAFDLLGLTDVYVSPITIFLLSIFFVNLAVVLAYRTRSIFNRAYMGKERPLIDAAGLKSSRMVSPLRTEKNNDDAVRSVETMLRDLGYAFLSGREAGTFLAIKNRFSPLGFFLFHLSFLFCLAGGLLISYTRFAGNLALTEGQSFDGDMKQFRWIEREPRFLKVMPGIGLYLENVHPAYEGNVPTELRALLRVRFEGTDKLEEMRVNVPVTRGPLSIIVQNIGVSPLIIVKDSEGRELDGAFVSLNVLKGREDSFRLESMPGYVFRTLFYPDYEVVNGVEKTRSMELRNPALHIEADYNDKKLSDVTVLLGRQITVGSYSLSFRDLRYWAEFRIIREYGKTPLIAGFILAAAGLIMRLIFFQKKLLLLVESGPGGTVIHIDGRSEYFPEAFKDEFADIKDKLKAVLNR